MISWPCPADQSGSIPDIGDVPAVEVVLTVAMHLMTASAVACGLTMNEDGMSREPDLAEARILINALAALVTAAAPDVGSMHAAPLRDGLTAVQRAFLEASAIPDPPGQGPGEEWTRLVTYSTDPVDISMPAGTNASTRGEMAAATSFASSASSVT